MNYIKRGDDFQFLACGVRSKRPPDYPLLTAATLTWRLLDKSGNALGAGSSGAMTQYDALENNFEAFISRAFTTTLTKYATYVLEIIITNAGLQTTIPVELIAVDVMPAVAP